MMTRLSLRRIKERGAFAATESSLVASVPMRQTGTSGDAAHPWRPFLFGQTHERAVAEFTLLPSNHTNPNRFALLPLRDFRRALSACCFVLKGSRAA